MIRKLLLTVLSSTIIFAQSTVTSNYENGLKCLAGKDTVNAIDFLKKDIEESERADSYYQLAMILQASKDYYKMNEAEDYYKKAVDKDPLNIKYRLDYGKYLEMIDVKVRDDMTARKRAKDQYEKVIEISHTNSAAYFRIGRLEYNEYLDYHNSFHKETYATGDNYFITSASARSKMKENQWEVSQDAQLSFEKEAKKSFDATEEYLLQAIKNDSSLYDAYTTLAGLYEDSGDYQKGVDVLKQLLRKKENDYSYHATLAFLYYRLNEPEQSYPEFQKAIALMTNEEKKEFLIGSVKILLQSLLDEKKAYSENELNQIVNSYWNSKDPLVITEVNERLLEHFARVTYANLRFGSEAKNIKGWQSDRGEALIRYGFPLKKIRYRPNTIDTGRKFIRLIKTDIWIYNNFTLAFTDQFLTNQFQFSSPYTSKAVPQYPGNTDDLVKLDLRYTKPEEYNPNFKGPIFRVPYKAYQFAASDKNKTDVYVGYQINYEDTATTKEQFSQGYDVGLFFNDNGFNRKFEKKETVSLKAGNDVLHSNSLYMKTVPQNGNLAFELMRKKDSGVASYHGKFSIKNFRGNELQISDLLLSKELELEKKLEGAIERKNISVVANPTNRFNSQDHVFLYYEIYNLGKKSSYTDFEQKLTIQKKGDDGIIGSVLSVVGLDGKGNKIMLTSNYQTEERDPQMYLQLDMSKYDAGNYLVTVTIKDKNSGKTVSVSTELTWQ
ncbi:MAG: GWxTD domain-containing protein [Ignavibacteriales bacterium]|nr:GWxTD domain-containing protein [Ignavibacteriales bacterium]